MKTVEYVIVANIGDDDDAGIIGDIFNMGLDAYESHSMFDASEDAEELEIIEMGVAKVIK